ncbi:hypothetical protein HAP94_05220 [Acidithiobacillus ferrivorans]|nr:hypothetical protein [Acidithiobacillus ferrivorans]
MNIYLIASSVVIAIAVLAEFSYKKTIDKVRDIALNNPTRLRGVTAEEALAKADGWEKRHKMLWPLTAVVVAGLLFLAWAH